MDSIADLVEPIKLEVRASVDNYKKGKEIVEANGVMIDILNPLKVTAKVTSPGGEIQHTELTSLPDGGLQWACTCNKQGEFCAHIVATAIAARDKSPIHRVNRKADGRLPAA